MTSGGMAPLLFLWLLLVLSASAQDNAVSFNISVYRPGRAFRQFIADTRAMLRVPDRPFVMQDTGRLPPQVDVPTRFMDLELRTLERGITLRMRIDNLYIVGFRNGIGEGTWFQFNVTNRVLQPVVVIPGSTLLRFDGDYQDGGIGILTPNQQLGRDSVELAIDVLSAHGNGQTIDDDTLKSYLRTLIVHFVESMRFTTIAERVARQLASADENDNEPRTSLGDDENLIHNWSDLSVALYAAANDVVQDQNVLANRFTSVLTNRSIRNAFQAAQALGLALLPNKLLRRTRRSVEDNADHVSAGLRLVQVIEVIVRRIDDEDPGDLYGSITIEDGIGSEKLFYRDWSETQSVGPGGKAQLIGPDRGISAAGSFAVNLDLMDKDSDPSPDDNVSKGLVVWNSLMVTSDQYDVVQSRIIDGESGQVELRFVAMTDAAVATVEVVILDSSEDTPNVYGIVTAMAGLDDETSPAIELMGLTREQQVGVAKGSLVPLHRKVVAVPMSSTMQVGVFLRDRNSFSDDEQIAAGFVTFETPRLTGEDSQEVSGRNGRIKVRVTWSTWFFYN